MSVSTTTKERPILFSGEMVRAMTTLHESAMRFARLHCEARQLHEEPPPVPCWKDWPQINVFEDLRRKLRELEGGR